jgi:hypothetical protein
MLEEEIKQNAERYASENYHPYGSETNPQYLIVSEDSFIAGAHSRDKEVSELEAKNSRLEVGMESLRYKNKFWEEFINYLNNEAIGDTRSIIEAVADNERNFFEGYVNVTKTVRDNQKLLIKFKNNAGNEYTAEWQAADNYACWQTTGMMGDDYSGYLLFPTYDDDKYFCLYYEC